MLALTLFFIFAPVVTIGAMIVAEYMRSADR